MNGSAIVDSQLPPVAQLDTLSSRSTAHGNR
jgi:hypothetical protein